MQKMENTVKTQCFGTEEMMPQYTGYLFVHFTGEQPGGEQVYFSVSRDGMHWEDLNQGEQVMVSGIG